MQITINNTQLEVVAGETLLATARRAGFEIPSLCFVEGAKHKPSCMVCVVKDCATGQILPSCATMPTEGMQIETESDEVKNIRSQSLELLLSDHRADCEAPCSMVCPKGLDIERMLYLYDFIIPKIEEFQDSKILFESLNPAIPVSLNFCEGCKAPCEKICRRASVDKAVPIRAIISELVEKYGSTFSSASKNEENEADKTLFQSRLGRFTVSEKEWLKRNVTTPSGCLHCACAGREGCKLRLYATTAGIKRPRYEASSSLPVMNKLHVTGNMWFEPAKCIRCGLCVYNSSNGFTFKNRGFVMQIEIPDENRANVSEKLAELCPTGALYLVFEPPISTSQD